MRTNKVFLKEASRLRNRTAGEKGEQKVDPDKIENDFRFQRELRKSKGYELREKIDALSREYTRIVEGKQHLANQQDEIRRFAENRNRTTDRRETDVVSGKNKNGPPTRPSAPPHEIE